MPPAAPTPRTGSDDCPGVLRLHEAADGGLARVRVPAGLLSADQLRALAQVAAEVGDGRLELTARGNVQVRAIPAGAEPEVEAALAGAGLLPSASHERVRNIVASPLAGLDGAGPDLTVLVQDLDRQLCARPRLAELPGRFLFAIDDGRGDVAALGADVTAVSGGRRDHVGLFAVPPEHTVAALLATAEAFLDERAAQGSNAWRVAELDGGAHAVAERALAALAGIEVRLGPPPVLPVPPDEPVGALPQPDGRAVLTVAVPLGRLTAPQARLLAGAAGARGVRITPWRSVAVPDVAAPRALADAARAAGLAVDHSSPWPRVSACTGRPGCARALADVQADAAAQVGRWPGRRVHWSGCERRCGRPVATEVDVVATEAGYRVAQ